ncbi:hypothetical protein ACS0TY_025091 [Phlomoides rotata]
MRLKLKVLGPKLRQGVSYGTKSAIFSSEYGDRWFWWRMGFSTVVFVGGATVNVWSDNLLMGLRVWR